MRMQCNLDIRDLMRHRYLGLTPVGAESSFSLSLLPSTIQLIVHSAPRFRDEDSVVTRNLHGSIRFLEILDLLVRQLDVKSPYSHVFSVEPHEY